MMPFGGSKESVTLITKETVHNCIVAVKVFLSEFVDRIGCSKSEHRTILQRESIPFLPFVRGFKILRTTILLLLWRIRAYCSCVRYSRKSLFIYESRQCNKVDGYVQHKVKFRKRLKDWLAWFHWSTSSSTQIFIMWCSPEWLWEELLLH